MPGHAAVEPRVAQAGDQHSAVFSSAVFAGAVVAGQSGGHARVTRLLNHDHGVDHVATGVAAVRFDNLAPEFADGLIIERSIHRRRKSAGLAPAYPYAYQLQVSLQRHVKNRAIQLPVRPATRVPVQRPSQPRRRAASPPSVSTGGPGLLGHGGTEHLEQQRRTATGVHQPAKHRGLQAMVIGVVVLLAEQHESCASSSLLHLAAVNHRGSVHRPATAHQRVITVVGTAPARAQAATRDEQAKGNRDRLFQQQCHRGFTAAPRGAPPRAPAQCCHPAAQALLRIPRLWPHR